MGEVCRRAGDERRLATVATAAVDG
jgi:hypothetical protein